MKYEVGMRIAEKMADAKEHTRSEGTIEYVYNDGMGLIYRKPGSNRDIFILTKGRDIQVTDTNWVM